MSQIFPLIWGMANFLSLAVKPLLTVKHSELLFLILWSGVRMASWTSSVDLEAQLNKLAEKREKCHLLVVQGC